MKKTIQVIALAIPLAVLGEWRVEYFGDSVFFKQHGTAVKEKLDFAVGPGFKWKGPRQKWSYIAEGDAAFAEGGKWEFRVKTGERDAGAYRVWVNGKDAGDCAGGIALGAGKARVTVYAKHRKLENGGEERTQAEVEYARAGSGEWKALKVEAPAEGSALGGHPARFEREFEYKEAEHIDFASRSYKFEVKEAGMYEVGCRMPGPMMFARLWLDEKEVVFYNGTRRGVRGQESFWGHPDRTGRKDLQRVDYFGKLKTVRWLEKGEHRLDAYAHLGPWTWEDEMDLVEEKGRLRLGVTKLKGANAESETGFWLEGLDAMVFEAKKPMRLRAQSASGERREYEMEVKDAEGRSVWKKKLTVGPEAGWWEYPCGEEGTFEYTVKNGKGEVVEGPWTFVVADPTPLKAPRMEGGELEGAGSVVVDRVECTEGEGGRHDFRDNGSSTLVKTGDGTYRATGKKGFHIEKRKYVRIKKGNKVVGFREAKEGEKGDMDSGTLYDWFAYTLKVKNPNRAHLVTVTVPNDIARYISAVAYDRKTGNYNAWNIEAGDAPAAGPWSKLSFFAWPQTDALDVMVYCSNWNHDSPLNRQSAAKSIELREFPDGPPPMKEPAIGWGRNVEYGWEGEQVDLGVNERTMPPLWSDPEKMMPANRRPQGIFYPWNAFYHAWKRFGETSAYLGNNICIFPVYSYCMRTFQGKAHRLLPVGTDRYANSVDWSVVEDPVDRDVFLLMVMQGAKHNVKIVADFMIQRVDPPIIRKWAENWGESAEGMLLSSGADEVPYRTFSNATIMNPAHPAVRKQLVAFTREFAKRYGKYPGFGGIRTRFWRGWTGSFEGWFYTPDLGCDDWTVGQFSKETGIKLEAAKGDNGKFGARKKKLYGELRKEWVGWRAKKCLTLREEMLAALKEHAPHAQLYMSMGSQHEAREEGCGLEDAYFAGRKELGWVENLAEIKGDGVECNFNDPLAFKNFNRRGGEWATPDIENWGGDRYGAYPQGVCCNSAYRASPYHLEPAAKALADGKLDMLLAGGPWCIPPADEELRKFVQAWRAIPEGEAEEHGVAGGGESPVAVRSVTRAGAGGGKERVFWLVNRTDTVRKAEIRFDGDAGEIIDGVSGELQACGDRMEAEVPPYQVRVYRAERAAGIAGVELPLSVGELEAIERDYKQMTELAERAKGAVRTRVNAGKKYTKIGNSNGLNRYDVTESIEDLVKPMREAYGKRQMHETLRLMVEFKTVHRWWFEAFGWPEGFCKERKLECKMLAETEAGVDALAAGEGSGMRVVEFADAPDRDERKFAAAGRGEALTLTAKGGAGWRQELEVQGWFGGGYGSIRVEDGAGNVLGRIEADAGAPKRFETRVMPQAIRRAADGEKLRLVGEGEKGLALLRAKLANLPARVVREMQILGPLDRYAGNEDKAKKRVGDQFIATEHGLDFELEPERDGFDAGKVYEGLYGEKVQWRKVGIGKGKIFNLAEICPYDASCGRGCALATFWVKAPRAGKASLNHTSEFFTKIWVNGEVVKPLKGGPTRVYQGTEVELREGWNRVMVKTACGSVGWYLGVTMSDAQELEFSAEER